MEAIERYHVANDWITLLFVAVFLLVAVCKLAYPYRFENFTKLIYTTRYFSINQNKTSLTDSFSFLLYGTQILSVSLFIFLLISVFSIVETTDEKILFVQIALAYLLFFSVKYFLEKITATLFKMEKIIDLYLLHKITYRNFIAVALLPITLFFMYATFSAKTLMLVIAGIVVLANLYILIIFYKKNRKLVSQYWFYFILYLCTFEIAPYFILYKAFTNA
ncbi:MAG TPA: DUF4271 domain-containing protein [Flavobacteriaceae bacterium]|nr:DUF4271 domain-containing protein [Flavobacteriaceae bacterium]